MGTDTLEIIMVIWNIRICRHQSFASTVNPSLYETNTDVMPIIPRPGDMIEWEDNKGAESYYFQVTRVEFDIVNHTIYIITE